MGRSLDDIAEPKRRRRSKGVKIGRTRVGKGLFAGKRFAMDEIIGEILGELIEDPDYGSDYSFSLENGCQLEPFEPFRYVNHSCEPNCRFDFLDESATETSRARRRIFLFARQEIRPHEELTIDYNWPLDSAVRCRCQSPSCRGWIVNAAHLVRRSVED